MRALLFTRFAALGSLALRAVALSAALLAPSTVSASSIEFEALLYFETFNDYWVNGEWGGNPLPDVGAVVDNTEYNVGYRIKYVSPADGDVIDVYFYSSAGALERSHQVVSSVSGLDYCLSGSINECESGWISWWHLTFDFQVAGHAADVIRAESWLNGVQATQHFFMITDNGVEPPNQNSMAMLKPNITNHQKGLTERELPSELAVTVTDYHGNPVVGTNVDFAVTDYPQGGGPPASGQGFDRANPGVDAITVPTEAGGIAHVPFILGDRDGVYEVTVTCASAPNDTVVFTAEAVPLQITVRGMFSPTVIPKQGRSGSSRGAGVFYAGQFDASGQAVARVNRPVGLLLREAVPVTIELTYYPMEPLFRPQVTVEWDLLDGRQGSESLTADLQDRLVIEVEAALPTTPGSPPRAINGVTYGDFGDTNTQFRLDYFNDQGAPINSEIIDGTAQIFFRKLEEHEPGLPNYAAYWSLVPEIVAIEDTDAALQEMIANSLPYETDVPGVRFEIYNYPGSNHTHYYDPTIITAWGQVVPRWDLANQLVTPTDLSLAPFGPGDDIHLFAETIHHEHSHLGDMHSWWNLNGSLYDPSFIDQANQTLADTESDPVYGVGDWIPDPLEGPGNEYPYLSPTVWDGEVRSTAAEANWTAPNVAAAEQQDWACPGYQTYSSCAP